jgi:hypothetical protein
MISTRNADHPIALFAVAQPFHGCRPLLNLSQSVPWVRISPCPPVAVAIEILWPVAVLENANIRALFRASLLTELCPQAGQTAAQIEFFSAPVDRQISVRLSRNLLISMT